MHLEVSGLGIPEITHRKNEGQYRPSSTNQFLDHNKPIMKLKSKRNICVHVSMTYDNHSGFLSIRAIIRELYYVIGFNPALNFLHCVRALWGAVHVRYDELRLAALAKSSNLLTPDSTMFMFTSVSAPSMSFQNSKSGSQSINKWSRVSFADVSWT